MGEIKPWVRLIVTFFGAGRFNLLGDRDFFASTIKFSF